MDSAGLFIENAIEKRIFLSIENELLIMMKVFVKLGEYKFFLDNKNKNNVPE